MLLDQSANEYLPKAKQQLLKLLIGILLGCISSYFYFPSPQLNPKTAKLNFVRCTLYALLPFYPQTQNPQTLKRTEISLVGLITKSEGILPSVAVERRMGWRTRQWPFEEARFRKKDLAAERMPNKDLCGFCALFLWLKKSV